MKKIDLHIHTVPTFSDSHFIFSLDTFKRYVSEAKLDAVAVTNHDVFDGAQFKIIKDALGITVFPGIEVNLDKGHVLIISSGSNLEDFTERTKLVSQKITKHGDSLSFDELEKMFGNLSGYLVIPHYEKTPPITGETFERLRPYVSAGEVDCAKKFIRVIKDEMKLTPSTWSAFFSVSFDKTVEYTDGLVRTRKLELAKCFASSITCRCSQCFLIGVLY